MGSRYLFIALYCWLEKYFSRGDYVSHKNTSTPDGKGAVAPQNGRTLE
jgi:hypothetical protein